MADIQVITKDDTLVVDSRLIAQELGIEHATFMRTIRKYLFEIQEFGHLRFENETVTNSVGARNSSIFCYLNEDQATYAMTLSRNTDRVRQCKRNLVKAFSKAKEVISTIIPQQFDEIEKLKLQNEVLEKQLQLRQIDHTMLTLHGKETVLALRGMADQIVETEKPTIEIIDERHNVTFKGQTLVQIKEFAEKKHGIKFKSGAEIKRFLERKKAGDLIAQTPRTFLSDYVPEENLPAVYRLICSDSRQLLLGE